MTLCITVLSKQCGIMGADTAVSTKRDGVTYRVRDDNPKVFVVDDQLIFISGDSDLSNIIITDYKNKPKHERTISNLQSMMKEYFNRYADIRPAFKKLIDSKDFFGILASIMVWQDNEPVQYVISSQNDFEIEVINPPDGGLKVVSHGINTGLANHLFFRYMENGYTLKQSITSTFDDMSYEAIGGGLQAYLINNNGISLMFSNKINETDIKMLPRSNYLDIDTLRSGMFNQSTITGTEINVNNNFAVDRDGNVTIKEGSININNNFVVDANGNMTANNADITGNINMTGGSIQWSNIGAPSYSQIGGSKPPTNADNTEGRLLGNGFTKIGSNYIYTGTLNANQINAGKISADRIDTDNLQASKIYQTDNPSNYAVVGGDYGDLILYNNNNEFFKVYNNADGSVTLYCWGQPFMTARSRDVAFHGETNVVARFG